MALAKNSMEGKAEEYVKRIENVLGTLYTQRGVYTAECRELRMDIKEIYIEAKDNGVPVKALKGLIKHRQLERKQHEIVAGLDSDEAAAYQSLVETLGELGAAAARAAGHTPDATLEEDDKRDLRSSNLRNTKTEDLEKIGRGSVEA